MKVAERVRQSYEKRPYPAVRDRRLPWQLPPWPWVDAVWQPSVPPRRILVAGCGTGNEAFALAHRFGQAEIVGVDFSPRSIAIARERQHSLGKKRVRFVAGDLAGPRFAKLVGKNFDFISCHGVLTYVPDRTLALKNLAEVLGEDGAFYLGVNGAAHYSQNWRAALPAFHIEIQTFRAQPALRKTLRLLDALSQHSLGLIARLDQEYLASDLLTPIIFNEPLAKWIDGARRAGLHFRGSYRAHRNLRYAFNAGAYDLFLPRSRAQVHEIVELVAPAQFHHLIFTRAPEQNPTWEERPNLLQARPRRTDLYVAKAPRKRGNAGAWEQLSLTSKSTNTAVDLLTPRWLSRILHDANAARTVGEIMASEAGKISTRSLSRHLYLLYLLAALNFEQTRTTS